MLSLWQAAPDEVPELVKHMENPPQTLIELFPRMDDDVMKKAEMHRHSAGFPEVTVALLLF